MRGRSGVVVLPIALVSEGNRSVSSSVLESEGDEPMTESGSTSSAENGGQLSQQIVLVNKLRGSAAC